MTERKNESTVDLTAQPERVAGKLRFYGVIFRVALIAGLLLLVAAVILLIFTDLIGFWFIILPLALITIGIVLARVESRLHLRLYHLNSQDPADNQK